MIRWGKSRRSFSARRAGKSGATAFNPLTLSPAIWYDPSDASTMFQTGTRGAPGAAAAPTNPVGLLLDKSGNNLDATQATATARPTVQTDAGSRQFLRGDGVDDLLGFLPSLALMKDFTLVIGDIARAIPANSVIHSITTAANDQLLYDNSPTGPGLATYDGVAHAFEAITSKDLSRVITLRCANGSQTIRINTVASGSPLTQATSGYTGTPTGALFGTSKFSQFAQSDIYGVLLFAGALSAPNLALVETYMGAKMGLTI